MKVTGTTSTFSGFLGSSATTFLMRRVLTPAAAAPAANAAARTMKNGSLPERLIFCIPNLVLSIMSLHLLIRG
jgi:hypothetical protein